MTAKMKMLRTRLFLTLLPFVVIASGMGIYAIALFSRLANSVDTAVAENYRSILAAQAMSQAVAGMERELGNPPSVQNLERKTFSEYQKRFEDNLAIQLGGRELPGERDLNEQLVTNYYAFRKALDTAGPIRTPKDQWMEQVPVANLARLTAALEKIRDLNYRAVLSTSRGIEKDSRDVSRLMVIGTVIVLVISASTCYQLSRSILQPIQLLTRATRKLGEGRLDKPVPVVSRDELGELAAAFNNMAAQLQEYRHSTTEEIVRLHRTMETTLASFPDPIFVLNKDGGIELKNPAADEFSAQLRLNGHLPDRLQSIAGKALESGENFLPHSFDEVIFYRINGSEKFFLPRILAMRNKENELLGVAVVLYDVTRFRLLDAAKTNLVATVSHELNTPLTSVRMVLHLLLEKTVGALTPKQEELLKAARNDAERLLRILNDLLDLARLEQGNAELRRETIAPSELLRTVIEDSEDKVTARGLKLNCAVEPGLPPVLVDRQRIGHVFNNLITNAIKYSPAGGQILLRAARAEENGGVQFTVTDQGPGISEEYHARIFDRFFRVPSQAKTGAGLGLSIAREITVAHGGRIGVKSSPGEGSTFFVVLKAEG